MAESNYSSCSRPGKNLFQIVQTAFSIDTIATAIIIIINIIILSLSSFILDIFLFLMINN